MAQDKTLGKGEHWSLSLDYVKYPIRSKERSALVKQIMDDPEKWKALNRAYYNWDEANKAAKNIHPDIVINRGIFL